MGIAVISEIKSYLKNRSCSDTKTKGVIQDVLVAKKASANKHDNFSRERKGRHRKNDYCR